MATPQQPPQQPIYPRDLSIALDRTYAKFTVYTDARVEQLAAQMRIGYEESLIRDNDLANSIKAIILTLGEIRQEMKDMRQEMREIRQEMKTEFATQAERHNELMVRVDKIERNG